MSDHEKQVQDVGEVLGQVKPCPYCGPNCSSLTHPMSPEERARMDAEIEAARREKEEFEIDELRYAYRWSGVGKALGMLAIIVLALLAGPPRLCSRSGMGAFPRHMPVSVG